jgi:hypothetical protein
VAEIIAYRSGENPPDEELFNLQDDFEGKWDENKQENFFFLPQRDDIISNITT